MPNNPTTPEHIAPTVTPTEAEIPTAIATSDTNENWQEFLEDDADCCGGCHHKPR